MAFHEKVKAVIADNPKLYDSRKYLGPAREAIKEVIRQKIRLFGSNNRF
ncbi:MAG: class II fructose-bisphosphate aldolase [Candidatus Carbobacillus sp.]|nr:class II fructose-bisphosphate aldolase [Candidatus Carbobacillus sp.]